ncbi:MAG: hypothetical protein ACI4P8_06515 [Akkermansia sp.]
MGALLPVLCLAGLLLAVGLVAWLSMAGLPPCALRALERELAAQGLQVQLERLRLAPKAGLAFRAEGIRASLPQPGAPPATLTARKLQAEWDVLALLGGDVLPQTLYVREAALRLPLSEDEALSAEAVDVRVRHNAKAQLWHAELRANIGGAATTLRVLVPESLLQGSESGAESPDPAALLAEHRETLLRVQRELARQDWGSPDKAPKLQCRVNLLGELPLVSLLAELPTLQTPAELCLRDLVLDARLEKNVLTINRSGFRTLSPDTQISLRGGYDLAHRELDVELDSTANLLQLAETYGDAQLAAWRARVSRPTPPTIRMRGHALLAEDGALERYALNTQLVQGEMSFDDLEFRHAELSLYLEDGNINLTNLELELSDGSLRAEGQVYEGQGQARAELRAALPCLQKLWQCVAGEPLPLPEGWESEGELQLDAQLGLQMPRFVPGVTRLQELLPTLTRASLRAAWARCATGEAAAEHPQLTLELEQPEWDGARAKVAGARLQLQAARLSGGELAAEEVQATLELQGAELGEDALSVAEAALGLSAASLAQGEDGLDGVQAQAQLRALRLPWADAAALAAEELAADVRCARATRGETTAEDFRLALTGARHVGGAADWRQMLADATGGLDVQLAALRSPEWGELRALALALHPEDEGAWRLALGAQLNERELRLVSRVQLRQEEGQLELRDASFTLSPAAAERWLAAQGWTTNLLRLPELVQGQLPLLALDLQPFRLHRAELELQVPELVRTPQLPALREHPVTLGLLLRATLCADAEERLLCAAHVELSHAQGGGLWLDVAGDLRESLTLTGRNTLTADLVDALIDDADAHEIIRDFRFTPGLSRVTAENINAVVKYGSGLDLRVHCDADIRDTDYLLGAYEDVRDAAGQVVGERLRTTWGAEPFVRVAQATCGVDVVVRLGVRDAAGQPLPDVTTIDLSSPYLRYDNRRWLRRQGFAKGPAESVVQGEDVFFDLEANTLRLTNIGGTCYPAYAFGMFFPDLMEYMGDIVLPQPVQVSTASCVFPLASRCTVPMSGCIRAEMLPEAPPGFFRFLGTKIPLAHFSGFVTLSDDAVVLSDMTAQCWGGVMRAAVQLGISGGSTSFDGFVEAQNMDLQAIAASYDKQFSPAMCNGEIRFRSPSPELRDLRAYGKLDVSDGNLLELSLFKPLNAFISDLPGNLESLERTAIHEQTGEQRDPNWLVRLFGRLFSGTGSTVERVGTTVTGTASRVPFANHLLRYDIQDAYAEFEIADGTLYAQRAKAKGYNLSVRLNVALDLDTLDLKGNLWPTMSSVPTVLVSPLTFLSDYMIDILIFGNVEDIHWRFGLDRLVPQEPSSAKNAP